MQRVLTVAGEWFPEVWCWFEDSPRRLRGHVRIYCDGRDCFWSWPLYHHASPQTNGDAIISAVDHAIRRHRHT